MKHKPKPPSQSLIASMGAMFNRAKARPEAITPATLGTRLAQIQAAHAEASKAAQHYLDVASKSVAELEDHIDGQRKKIHEHRDTALRAACLPAALLAEELAAAEREVVKVSCTQALLNVDNLTDVPTQTANYLGRELFTLWQGTGYTLGFNVRL